MIKLTYIAQIEVIERSYIMSEAFLTAEEIYEVDKLNDLTLSVHLTTLPPKKGTGISYFY